VNIVSSDVVIRDRVRLKIFGPGENGFEGKLRKRKRRIEKKRTFSARAAPGGKGRGAGRCIIATRT
jgi:hypothetical protein